VPTYRHGAPPEVETFANGTALFVVRLGAVKAALVEDVMLVGKEYLQDTGIPRRRDLGATRSSPDDVILEDPTSFPVPVCRISQQEDV